MSASRPRAVFLTARAEPVNAALLHALFVGGGCQFVPPEGRLARLHQQRLAHAVGGGQHRGLGDFDGDGRTDLAIYRSSTGTWHARGQTPVAYGDRGDLPVVGDYNGDGAAR